MCDETLRWFIAATHFTGASPLRVTSTSFEILKCGGSG